MLTFILTSVSAYTLWEMQEPTEIVLRAGDLITEDQLNGALKQTDCSKYVDDQHTKVPANDTCWHYGKPDTCPGKGYIKFKEIPLVNAKVGAAAVNVANGKEVSLVVGNVTYDIAPTKFTAQPEGIFTVPCDGVLTGVIQGAAAAVQGVVDLAAEGTPIVGELAAQPIDGIVMDLEHKLEGLCGVLEAILEDLLDIIGQVIHGLLNDVLPAIIQTLLQALVKLALGSISAEELKALTA